MSRFWIIPVFLLTSVAGCLSADLDAEHTSSFSSGAEATYDLDDGTVLTIQIRGPTQYMEQDGRLSQAHVMSITMAPQNGYALAFKTIFDAHGLRIRDQQDCYAFDPCDFDGLSWNARSSPLPLGVGLPLLLDDPDGMSALAEPWDTILPALGSESSCLTLPATPALGLWPYIQSAGTFCYEDGMLFPSSFSLGGIRDDSGKGQLRAWQAGTGSAATDAPKPMPLEETDGGRWLSGGDVDIMATGMRIDDALDALAAQLDQEDDDIACVVALSVHRPLRGTNLLPITGPSEYHDMEIQVDYEGSHGMTRRELHYRLEDGAYSVSPTGSASSASDCVGAGSDHLAQILEAAVVAPIRKAAPWDSISLFGFDGWGGRRVDVSHVPPDVDLNASFQAYTPYLLWFDASSGLLMDARVGPGDIARLDAQGIAASRRA